MSAAQPGDLIAGRYRIEAPIGSGAYASVFRARDETLARAVAIKFLLPGDERRRELLAERFLREARLAAAVDHPNVARTFDFGADRGRPFMVMELLQGQSLSERMERGAIPIGELVDLACEILAGLDAVHRAGIVHRDLKPDNVILASDGLAERARIVDFGVSRALNGDGDVRSALTTRDGLVVGTPEYMSPEQARGIADVDARADIYAMGAILYEALTGRLPYRATNMADLIVAIASGGAPSVHQLRPEVSEAVSGVVECAMALAPEDRFATAATMAQSLLAAVGRGASSAQGSWLPGRVEARPTVSEVVAPGMPGVRGGSSLAGLSGTAELGGVELDQAIRDAKLGDSDGAREAARAPTLEAAPGSFPPRAVSAPARAPAAVTAPSPASAPAPGTSAPPSRPARPTTPLSGLPRSRNQFASGAPGSTAPPTPPPPPPPGTSARPRYQTPPAAPDAFASMRPRRETPSAAPGWTPPPPPPPPPGGSARVRHQTPPAVPEPPMSLAAKRPRRATPSGAPALAPPSGAASRPAPPPSRPPLASIEAQLADVRGPEGASAPVLPLARIPGFRRPGIASARPRVGVARTDEPAPPRSFVGWLLAGVLVAGLAVTWGMSRHPEGREWLDRASRALGRVAPGVASHLPFRKSVEIRLVGVPRTARIRLDGTPIANDVFEVARDGALHLVEVELPGMETWSATFEGHADRSFGVVLIERERPGAGK